MFYRISEDHRTPLTESLMTKAVTKTKRIAKVRLTGQCGRGQKR